MKKNLVFVFVIVLSVIASCKKTVAPSLPEGTNTPNYTQTVQSLSTYIASQQTAEAAAWTATVTLTITETPNMTQTIAALGTMQAGADEQATIGAAGTQTAVASSWSPSCTPTRTMTPDLTGTAGVYGTTVANQLSHTPTVSPTFTATATITRIWEYIGGGSIAGAYTNHSDGMDMDVNTGIPYIVFQANSTSGATVVKYNGSSWETVGAAGFVSGSNYFYPSIIVRNSLGADYPVVSLRDYNYSYRAVVMYYSTGSGSWNYEYYGMGGTTGNYTNLALSAGGTTYLAYSDGYANFAATVLTNAGIGYNAVGSQAFSDGEARYLTMDLYNETPYVAYVDVYNAGKATVMRYNGTAWEPVGSKAFSPSYINIISLSASSGTPYVAFADGSCGNKATVMKYNGAAWETVGSCISSGMVDGTAVRVYNGEPYVAFNDESLGKLIVMKYSGSAWEYVGSSTGIAPGGGQPCMEIYGGYLYVAFTNGNTTGDISLMKFGPL